MDENIIDQVYGSDFIGTPVAAGAAWPRFDAMLRNGQYVTGVPRAYTLAVARAGAALPGDAKSIDDLISMVCFPYNRTARIASLQAAISARPPV